MLTLDIAFFFWDIGIDLLVGRQQIEKTFPDYKFEGNSSIKLIHEKYTRKLFNPHSDIGSRLSVRGGGTLHCPNSQEVKCRAHVVVYRCGNLNQFYKVEFIQAPYLLGNMASIKS